MIFFFIFERYRGYEIHINKNNSKKSTFILKIKRKIIVK